MPGDTGDAKAGVNSPVGSVHDDKKAIGGRPEGLDSSVSVTSLGNTKGAEFEDSTANVTESQKKPFIEQVLAWGTAERWKYFASGFKRNDTVIEVGEHLTRAERVVLATSRAPLQRSLKNRHLQMIAIGGAIGTGLFIGSGKALQRAGPAGILIGWGLTSTMILIMCFSLGELSVTFAVSGGFTTFATRFIDESYGFANNFNYMMQALVVLPLEIIAATIAVGFWKTPPKYNTAFAALFYVVIVAINLFGVKGYGEAEFVFSLIKVITIIGFLILGIILCARPDSSGEPAGGKPWVVPGPFVGNSAAESFGRICAVFVTAAFSFAGTELVGLAAAETENPRKSVPRAAKQVFWRITLFYILTLMFVGLLVRSDDPRLAGAGTDARTSPIVLAIESHGIQVLPHIINVVILTAVLSVGNSCIYSCSRVLTALAEQEFLPKIFGYIDRRGRPLFAIGFASAFGLLCFLVNLEHYQDVFDWMLALSGLSAFFTWFTICVAHIRFRAALKAQGRGTDELAFVSPTGVIGSYYGAILIVIILIANAVISLCSPEENFKPNAESFFKGSISLPIFIIMYFGHKIYTKNWKLFFDPKSLDIDTGRRELDIEIFKQELAEERAIIRQKSWPLRVYHFWC